MMKNQLTFWIFWAWTHGHKHIKCAQAWIWNKFDVIKSFSNSLSLLAVVKKLCMVNLCPVKLVHEKMKMKVISSNSLKNAYTLVISKIPFISMSLSTSTHSCNLRNLNALLNKPFKLKNSSKRKLECTSFQIYYKHKR